MALAGRQRHEAASTLGTWHHRQAVAAQRLTGAALRPSRRQDDGEVERLVAQVREGVAGVDGQRRQRREDAGAEVLRAAACSLGPVESVGQRAARPPRASELGTSSSRQSGSSCRPPWRGARSAMAASCSAGEHAVRPGAGDARPRSCCFRPATRTMKNSSRLAATMRQELEPLEERQARVARLGEDALVEGEPRQLAVDEHPGVVQFHGQTGGVRHRVRPSRTRQVTMTW